MTRRVVAAVAVVAGLIVIWTAVVGDARSTRTNAPVVVRAATSEPTPTRGDAVRTAAGFLSSMTLEALLDVTKRRSLIATYAKPSARPALDELYARERARVVASYRRPPRIARAGLVGYRVDGFSRQSATVSLWAASIGGSGNYRPVTGWSTTTVGLVWTAHGWRITGVSEKPGPSADWPIESLASEAKTFRSFRHAP